MTQRTNCTPHQKFIKGVNPSLRLTSVRNIHQRTRLHLRTQANTEHQGDWFPAISETDLLQTRLSKAERCLVVAIASQDYASAAAARDTIRDLQLRIRINQVKTKEDSATSDQCPIYFPIGSIILHRRYSYHGLIVGRDPKCLAPEEWIQKMMVDRLPHGRNQPFYNVLVDEKDRPGAQMTYVSEDNIMLFKSAYTIEHAWLERFMKVVPCDDGTVEYFPQAWLREKYIDEF